MIERTEVFRSLVGSHNYNLNTEGSDKDYKVFILPTFDDLYFNRSYSKSIIGADMDLDIHDLRKATDLWFKANINFLEVLYSSDIELKHNNLSIASHHDMLELISRRDEIARMNLPFLYSACIGMHKQKRHSVLKGTESTQVLVDQFGYDCYAEDTLFLTNHGWKFYDDVTETDLLATVSPDNHALCYQSYLDRVKKPYSGIMYEMDNVYSNCLVTGNHRMYISPIVNRNNFGLAYHSDLAKWQYQPMKNLIDEKRSYYHVLTTPCNANPEYPISDDLLNLIGLYVSEGTINFRNDEPKAVIISQTAKGKDEIFSVMDRFQYFSFKKYDYEKETKWVSHNKNLISFLLDNCGHGSMIKRLPDFIGLLSKRQAQVLLHALYLGDGTDKKINDQIYGWVYYSNNRKLAEDVQALGLIAEQDCLLWGGNNGYESISNYTGKPLNMFQVYLRDKTSTPKVMIFKPYSGNGKSSCSQGIEEIQYDGNIVCFTVPNENLITQRRGKVAIHGNTKQALHSIRVLDFLIRFQDGKFHDFKQAIWYEDQDKDREKLLALRHGQMSLQEYYQLSDQYLQFTELHCQDCYRSHKPDTELYDHLTQIIRQVIKNELR